jgi:hypothetical protein
LSRSRHFPGLYFPLRIPTNNEKEGTTFRKIHMD